MENPFLRNLLYDVEVPKENLIGDLNKGWTIAKKLLQHEENYFKFWFMQQWAVKDVVSIAKKHFGELDGEIANPIFIPKLLIIK